MPSAHDRQLALGRGCVTGLCHRPGTKAMLIKVYLVDYITCSPAGTLLLAA